MFRNKTTNTLINQEIIVGNSLCDKLVLSVMSPVAGQEGLGTDTKCLGQVSICLADYPKLMEGFKQSFVIALQLPTLPLFDEEVNSLSISLSPSVFRSLSLTHT